MDLPILNTNIFYFFRLNSFSSEEIAENIRFSFYFLQFSSACYSRIFDILPHFFDETKNTRHLPFISCPAFSIYIASFHEFRI